MNDTSTHETFTLEGIEFDLEIAYRDVTGVEWQWSGERTPDGLPLMWECSHKSLSHSTITFPDLYWKHGPLIPVRELSGADFRAAIDPDYAATVAAGYVEAHIAAAVAPALTASHLPPSPLEKPGFRRFLNSISGRTPTP
ncbi:phiSA1p31-related protein [Streptomyces microflavus]|uniref:phiSA1p31-related protein n=1 Tax=Streptomyces microflavus TaxID=1919 RepID=UPI002E3445FB|nr:phiSA1p31-related protein [Streptomyces microflavus]